MSPSHEEKVERFYSHGSDVRCLQEGGFLSFGLWNPGTKDYHEACENLISKVLQQEVPIPSGRILNVASGYGAETLRIFQKLLPERIVAIDITGPHVEYAREHIHSLGLSDRIQFEKMDACKVDFPPSSFDYVIGIEGPAHFDTREMFFRKAFELLKPGGRLLLSDITVDNTVAERNAYNRFIGNFCAKHWYMPKANWMPVDKMRQVLESVGFRIELAESVGEQVYPGFSRFNLGFESIKNAIWVRGVRIGIALSFISWLLGHIHRRKMIDYVIVRAVKP